MTHSGSWQTWLWVSSCSPGDTAGGDTGPGGAAGAGGPRGVIGVFVPCPGMEVIALCARGPGAVTVSLSQRSRVARGQLSPCVPEEQGGMGTAVATRDAQPHQRSPSTADPRGQAVPSWPGCVGMLCLAGVTQCHGRG